MAGRTKAPRAAEAEPVEAMSMEGRPAYIEVCAGDGEGARSSSWLAKGVLSGSKSEGAGVDMGLHGRARTTGGDRSASRLVPDETASLDSGDAVAPESFAATAPVNALLGLEPAEEG